MNGFLENLLNTPTLFLVPPALIVINQVLIKQYGMEPKKAIIINVVLSLFFVVWSSWGTVDLVKAILIALLLGFASGGLYDVKKLFMQK